MNDENAILIQARLLAERVVKGELQANEGCELIGSIPGAIYVGELDELTHLAHLQYGHEDVGFTAADLVKDIVKECEVLLELRS